MAKVGMEAGDLPHWPSSHAAAYLRGSAGTTGLQNSSPNHHQVKNAVVQKNFLSGTCRY